ncbi:Alpha/Beta hydrolase protein [Blakeslea trispora]|nr:Alpha/Beta hydrolase protein [Blakeslea trispora]
MVHLFTQMRTLFLLSIPIMGLVNAASTSDTLPSSSLSDILAGQNLDSGAGSFNSLVRLLDDAAQNNHNSTQRDAMNKLKSLIQQNNGSQSGLDIDMSAQLKSWFSSYGSLSGFKDFDQFEDLVEQYASPDASLPRRDSTVSAATQEQLRVLKKHAMIASGAYCIARIPTWSCTLCRQAVSDGKIVKVFKTPLTDTNGFVMTSAADQTIYLSFRGSVSSQNWVTNFNYRFTSFDNVKGARAHSGFYSAVKDSSRTYLPVIKSLLDANPKYKVVVTGHSLGGALALLAGIDLLGKESRITSSNLKIYTYGGPRVGDSNFVDYVAKSNVPVLRSVNGLDPIPQAPPRVNGYVHAGVEAWRRSTGAVVVCNTQSESNLCSNTVAAIANNIADHLRYEGLQMGVCV